MCRRHTRLRLRQHGHRCRRRHPGRAGRRVRRRPAACGPRAGRTRGRCATRSRHCPDRTACRCPSACDVHTPSTCTGRRHRRCHSRRSTCLGRRRWGRGREREPEPERAPERGSPEWTACRPGYRYPPGWRRPAAPSGTDDCRNRPGRRSVRSGPPAWRIGNPDCRPWRTVRCAASHPPGVACPKRHVRFARFRRRSVRKRPSHRTGS